MISILEILSIQELKSRKIYLLNQLKKIDDELLKRENIENNEEKLIDESINNINKEVMKIRIKIKKK